MRSLFLSAIVFFTGSSFAFAEGFVRTKDCGVFETIKGSQPVIRLQDGRLLRINKDSSLISELGEGQLVCLRGVVDLTIENIAFCELSGNVQNVDCIGLNSSRF